MPLAPLNHSNFSKKMYKGRKIIYLNIAGYYIVIAIYMYVIGFSKSCIHEIQCISAYI